MEKKYLSKRNAIIIALTIVAMNCYGQQLSDLSYTYEQLANELPQIESRAFYISSLGASIFGIKEESHAHILFNDESIPIAMVCVEKMISGNIVNQVYALVYKKETMVYHYEDSDFASHHYDVIVPINTITQLFYDMHRNNIPDNILYKILLKFVKERIVHNMYGPGDGYYASPEYTYLQYINLDTINSSRQFYQDFKKTYPIESRGQLPEIMQDILDYSAICNFPSKRIADRETMLAIMLYLKEISSQNVDSLKSGLVGRHIIMELVEYDGILFRTNENGDKIEFNTSLKI